MLAANALSAGAQALLRIDGLTVNYVSATRPALSAVHLEIGAGEIVGVLGESGSGKSTLALAVLGLLCSPTRVAGSISFKGQELLRLDESGWQAIRGVRIATILQEPGISFSPFMRVGNQIAEVIRAHDRCSKSDRRRRTETLLADVGFADINRICRAYPHQLSGGELHRIAIAQALACRPEVLIADEPTKSLDSTLQREILALLQAVNRRSGCSLIFITHDPQLLAGFAQRVVVMYAGHIVEEGPLSRVFGQPLHPYTKGLLRLTRSSLHQPLRRGERLPAIPGSLSELDPLATGCVFAPRCYARTSVCLTAPPNNIVPEDGRRVECFNYGS